MKSYYDGYTILPLEETFIRLPFQNGKRWTISSPSGSVRSKRLILLFRFPHPNLCEIRFQPGDQQSKSCDLCMKKNHPVRRSPRFLQMPVPERGAYIKKKSFCLNCFSRGHQVKDCASQHNCFTCKGRHNMLLHKDARPENSPTPVPAQPSSYSIVWTYFTSEARSSRDKLLGTAIVDFWHKGTTYPSRALLDPASEANFISERMFRLMKLPFQTVRAEVTGINGKVNRTFKVCHISIRSSHGPPVQIEIEAFVLSQVADDLPSCTIAQATLEGMPNIHLADRDVSGRYTVSLPFRDPTNINLGHSRPGALAQFLKNEEFLGYGLKKNFRQKLIFKPDSTTTKVRVVFNASSKSTNGVSLNDILYPGPVLQSDLTTQILKWRFIRVVFNAAITKMNRQIMVDPIHTPFQRILFRNKEGQLGDYELNSAIDVQSEFPLAGDIIKSYMYVDDVLAGAHNEAAAIAIVNELQDALGSAGFALRKWTSNVKSVLSCIPKCHLLNADFLDIEEASTAITPGIRWKATTDEFCFVISPQDIKSAYTKREVLGQIAKLFDPAGWLSCFVIQAKVFMQELGWDNKLPSELHHRWQDFTKSYSFLDDSIVLRCVTAGLWCRNLRAR
ncbi:uncharacterized protein [Drosophila tropicalis]|uniref:uncharacterized protein n=1 Tax=Drosophila tropicalis TaxID=46794 RepID=UPI0035AB74DC